MQYFHDNSFAYDRRNRFRTPTFWVNAEDAGIAAQHYGLGSWFLDWTFDPLVALTFAGAGLEVGGEGTVLLRRAVASFSVLPPSFLTRLWRQAGYVQQEPCKCDCEEALHRDCGDRFASVDSYNRLTFTVANAEERDFLRAWHDNLIGEANDQVGRLAQWSLERPLKEAPRPLDLRLPLSPAVQAWLYGLKGSTIAELPAITTVHEEVEQVFDMLERCAVKCRNGRVTMDVEALGRALGFISNEVTAVAMKDEAILGLSPRRQMLTRLAATGESHLRSVAQYGLPSEKHLPYE